MNQLPWTSSKKEIYSAYKDILKKYEDAIQNPPPAQQQAREVERKESITQKVSQLTPESLIDGIARMKISIAKTLDILSESLTEEAKKLSDIRAAKEVAKVELERISDGKLAAEAIEIWLNEHEQQKAELLSELSSQKNDLEAEMDDQRAVWESEQRERQRLLKEEQLERKKMRERDEQEYVYNLMLQRKKDDDDRKVKAESFEREISAKRQAQEDEIARARQEFEREKDEIENLRKLAETWQHKLEDAQKNARDQAVKETTSKYEHELSIFAQKSQSSSEIANIKIQNLESYISKQELRIEELSRRLDLETNRVHEIANKAVEGASGATAFSAVNRIAVEQAKRPMQGGGEEQRR